MKIYSAITILFQIAFTSIVLLGIYMIYALFDVIEFDLISDIGFMIFQPILGLIFTGLTILICLILGLPIRLVKVINQSWKTKQYIPVLGAVIGIVLLFLSFLNNEIKEVIIENEKILKKFPNITLALTGWFFIAFCLLHLYPQSMFNFLLQFFDSQKKQLRRFKL